MADMFWDFAHSLWFGGQVKSPHGHACPALYVPDIAAGAAAKYVDGATLPTVRPGHVRLVCVSDTHECHRRVAIPPGDILLHAGDILLCNRRFSAKASAAKLADFNAWLGSLPHAHKVVIAGNHDLAIEKLGRDGAQQVLTNAVYLEDEAVQLLGLTIHGSPYSQGKSHNRAFQPPKGCREAPTLDRVPPRCDVLMTHQSATTSAIKAAARKARVHVAGHFHEQYGVGNVADTGRLAMVCSALDGKYRPANPPIVVDVPVL